MRFWLLTFVLTVLRNHLIICVRNLAKEGNDVFLFLIPFRQIGFAYIDKFRVEGLSNISCSFIGKRLGHGIKRCAALLSGKLQASVTKMGRFSVAWFAHSIKNHLAIFITNKLNKLLLAAALAELEFLKGSAIEVSCVAPSSLGALYGILYTAHNVPPIR